MRNAECAKKVAKLRNRTAVTALFDAIPADEGTIYRIAGAGGWMARFNLAWIMEHYDEAGEAVKP